MFRPSRNSRRAIFRFKLREKENIKEKNIRNGNKKNWNVISFCCAAPAIIKKKKISEIKFFENIGSKIGLLFQIADDLIDLKSNSREAGKKTGKDQKKVKLRL